MNTAITHTNTNQSILKKRGLGMYPILQIAMRAEIYLTAKKINKETSWFWVI
jgi:hypothetical protein